MSQAGVAGVLEQKKSAVTTTKASPMTPEKALKAESVGSFLTEMKSELAKVTWTNREEMQVYIKVVVSATVVFGLGVYFVDLLIQGVLAGLGVLVRLIGG